MERSRTARRGRPQIQDGQTVVDIQQPPEKKRLRMRLAQRSYRARKEEAQQLERIRGEELSSALDNAFEIFSTLHDRILDTPQIRNSPDILFHLNDAARRMTAIASSRGKFLPLSHGVMNSSQISTEQAHETKSRPTTTGVLRERDKARSPPLSLQERLAPGQLVTGDSRVMVISLWTNTSNRIPMPARIIRACFKRAVTILSDSMVHGNQPSALALPLRLLGRDTLMANSLQGLESFHPSVADILYPLHSAPRQPHMYRVVEGGTRTVRRAPAPLVQQIERGKTRTILDTSFAPLRGEWLEAVDVEEYLEDRGIYVRNAVGNGTTSSEETSYEKLFPDIEQDIPILAPLGSVPGKELAWTINGSTPSQLGSMERSPSVSLSADFHGHEPSDYSVFGLPRPRQWRSNNSQHLSTAMTGVPSTDVSSAPLLNFKPQDAQVPTKASRIHVNLDKLVHLLAENAMCLGPVPGIRKAAVDASIRGSIILP
ncbi:hypothetical protein BDV23DRAFT_178647 [Aspergillus alliaceus]|uniref:BZIP domain-containing protein n=1 Tax=Petromyces alliaceus TaxID=209559 RepID=A0A5N7CMW8_PETAA|nr:hypothetical protein BDV23DRAFT_178647 [Aspergillus alliaceus]